MKKRYWVLLVCVILALIWVFFSSLEETPTAAISPHKLSATLSPEISTDTPKKTGEVTPKDPKEKYISPTECLIKKIKLSECDDKCFIQRLKKNKHDALADFVSVNWKAKPEDGYIGTKLGNFYQALRPAGLLYGAETDEKPDYQKAESLIEDIVYLDSQNAFPAYYHALILLRQNKIAAAKAAMKIAHERTGFTSYVVEFHKQLKLATLHHPQDYIRGVEVYSAIPMPNMMALEELIELDSNAAIELGKRLTAPAEKYQGKYFDLLWNALEHQVGISLLKKVAPDEAQKVFNYKEWMEINPDESYFIEGKSGCDVDLLKEELQKLKEVLTQE